MEKLHPNLIKLGKKILAARKLKGYSQEHFAVVSNFDRSYIGGVERGERNIPMQNLFQFALSLKVEPKELLPTLKELKTPYNKEY